MEYCRWIMQIVVNEFAKFAIRKTSNQIRTKNIMDHLNFHTKFSMAPHSENIEYLYQMVYTYTVFYLVSKY